MIIQPQYLDSAMLATFLANIEGGVRQSLSSRTSQTKGGGGGVDLGLVKTEGSLSGEQETELTYEDHDASRLQRLIAAGNSDSEGLAWVEVGNPDDDFKDIGMGAVIHWECDVYIPVAINAFSNPKVKEGLQIMEDLMPQASALKLDVEGLPTPKELGAMAAAINSFGVAPVVIGEDDCTDWRIIGSLKPDCIVDSAEIDGRARIIAKVKKAVSKDSWYLLASLPGMNLIGRDERRKLERQGPQEDQKGLFEEGPLLVVEYLAIYS